MFLFLIIAEVFRLDKIIHDWAQLPVALTTRDVALVLGVTPEHVAKLCQKGTIQATKISPRVWSISKAWLMGKIENPEEN